MRLQRLKPVNEERRQFGSAAILAGKFFLESSLIMYIGVGVLVVASAWNAWPRRSNRAVCPSCDSHTIVQTGGVQQREM